jgi:pSer/pThr/pTyr-binding forkhead associated (FHA) protein
MNNVVGRVIIFTLAGLAAGLFTWFISDLSGFVRLSDTVGTLSAAEQRAYYIIFCIWGGSIGVLLGVAETLMSGGRAEWLKTLGLGLLVGIISGVIGGSLGMSIFGALYANQANNPLQFLQNVIARAAGWALIGALAGTADGWRKLSPRVGRNGLIGGLLGGLLGGMTFEIIPYLIPGIRPGPVSRLFGFAITGAMIGLFIALVQELLKEAWLKVMVGRNEGKEILIYQDITRIGRSELSDVPLFGDPAIAKDHARLKAMESSGFIIEDVSHSETGVYVNGVRISGAHPLRSGDVIQIASKIIVFYERYTRTPSTVENRDRVSSTPPPTADLPSLADLPTVPVGPRSTNPVAAPEPASPVSPPRRTYQGNAVAGQLITRGSRLVVISGPYTGSTFPVRAGSVLGRSADVEIALPADGKASRRHAQILAEGGIIVIEDLGSTNGTFVNGQRISRQSLVGGDTIVVGTTTLRLE